MVEALDTILSCKQWCVEGGNVPIFAFKIFMKCRRVTVYFPRQKIFYMMVMVSNKFFFF